MPRRPKSKKSNHYFTKDHENAIIEYCSTDCNKKKTEIYVKMLKKDDVRKFFFNVIK